MVCLQADILCLALRVRACIALAPLIRLFCRLNYHRQFRGRRQTYYLCISALNIPSESEQKQKFQITKSPRLARETKRQLNSG